nr:MAG TPA: hypothetical protein [Caudoviricetes sp.]
MNSYGDIYYSHCVCKNIRTIVFVLRKNHSKSKLFKLRLLLGSD